MLPYYKDYSLEYQEKLSKLMEEINKEESKPYTDISGERSEALREEYQNLEWQAIQDRYGEPKVNYGDELLVTADCILLQADEDERHFWYRGTPNIGDICSVPQYEVLPQPEEVTIVGPKWVVERTHYTVAQKMRQAYLDSVK